MKKIKISAVVNTRNEEKNISACLASLGFVDEIIVVDMESEDQTVTLAKKYTDHIYSHKKMGYVEPARNFAINKATGDWILIVDADERIGKELAKKLIEIKDENKADFVRIPRKNIIFGQWIEHSQWWPDYNVRFFKKDAVEWQDEIHSVPITSGTGFNLEAEDEYAIEHFHYNSIDEFFERALRYSTQQSRELIKSGYHFDPKDLITKPISEFVSRFFASEGYKDGLHGLVLSLLQFFAILLVYLKVWQHEGHQPVREKQFTPLWQDTFKKKFAELQYWFITAKLEKETSKVNRFYLKVKRKILK